MSLDAFREALDRNRDHQAAATEIEVGKPEQALFCECERLPTVKEAETRLILEAMQRAKDNQGIAARLLGITRQTLNSKLKKIREEA